MTSPDNAPIPPESQGQPVGAWGDDFPDLLDGLALVFGNVPFIGEILEFLGDISDGDLTEVVNEVLALVLGILADLLDFVPIVGGTLSEIVDNIAAGLNATHETATTAQETAETANTNAGTALTDSAGALLKATDAKLMAIGTYNYVENYGFESSVQRVAFPPPSSDWAYVNNSGEAHTASYYVKLQPPSSGYAPNSFWSISDKIPTVPGDRFYLEWWQYRASANFRATVFVRYMNSSDVQIGSASDTVPNSTAPNNAWTKYSFTTATVAPAGTAYALASLMLLDIDPLALAPTPSPLSVLRGTPAYVAGKYGNALSSSVVNNMTVDKFLSSTGADGGALTTGTIEAWVKAPSTSTQRVAVMHSNWYHFGCNSSGQAQASVAGGGTILNLTTTTVITDNAWHHLALVLNAGKPSFYVDGVLRASSAVAQSTVTGDTDAGVAVGGYYGSNTFDWSVIGGLIDDFRISTTVRYSSTFTPPAAALTWDSSTAALYSLDSTLNAVTPSPPALAGVWRFDDVVVKKVDRGLEPRVTALEGGGTRTVYTSTTIFNNPGTGTLGAALIGGGYGGQGPGTTPLSSVKLGGTHGGYVFRELNCVDLAPVLAIVVGTGGAGNGGAGTRTSLYEWTGSALGVLYATSIEGNVGSILTRQGAVASSSTPGKGGDANGAGTGPGQSGASSALASGGAGGPAANAGDGAPGGSVSTSEPTPCGGGGAGAGGSFGGAFSRPGHGGAGGSPGGGGGGAGAKDTLNAGAVSNGGPGAPGRAIILWRPA